MAFQDRAGSVQSRRRLRRVVPREPPQVTPLVGAQAVAHEDDALDLVERGTELDALHEGRADLVVHFGASVPRTGMTTPSNEELAVFLQLLSVNRDGAT